MLQNKEGLWKSDDIWKFTFKGDKILIENINETKVWGTTSDSKLILENFEDNKDGQLWKIGEPDNKEYFTLENDKVSKLLTATSSNNSILKGNITLDEYHLLKLSCCKKQQKNSQPRNTGLGNRGYLKVLND